MAWEDDEWGRQHRLTDGPLPDIEPHVARAADGTIYVAWQAMAGEALPGAPQVPAGRTLVRDCLRDGRGGQRLVARRGSGPRRLGKGVVGPLPDGSGRQLRRLRARRSLRKAAWVPKWRSHRRPASRRIRPSQWDGRGRPWVAWETSGVHWGKDMGARSRRAPAGNAPRRGAGASRSPATTAGSGGRPRPRPSTTRRRPARRARAGPSCASNADGNL